MKAPVMVSQRCSRERLFFIPCTRQQPRLILCLGRVAGLDYNPPPPGQSCSQPTQPCVLGHGFTSELQGEFGKYEEATHVVVCCGPDPLAILRCVCSGHIEHRPG